ARSVPLCTYEITVHAASTAESPVVPRAKRFVIMRFFGVSGFANARVPLTSAPSSGRRGMRRRIVVIADFAQRQRRGRKADSRSDARAFSAFCFLHSAFQPLSSLISSRLTVLFSRYN